MSATVWLVIAIVGFSLAGVALVASVFLFLKLRIPAIIGDLTGRTVDREIRAIKDANAANTSKRRMQSAVSPAMRDVENSSPEEIRHVDTATQKLPSGGKTAGLQNPYEDDASYESTGQRGTTALGTAQQGTTVLDASQQGTTVLDASQQGTTVLDASQQGTTVLDASQQGTTVLEASQQGTTVLEASQQGTTVLEASQQGTTVLDASQQGTTVLDASQQGTTVLEASQPQHPGFRVTRKLVFVSTDEVIR